MKRILFLLILTVGILFSCNLARLKHVKGNGNVVTETRDVMRTDKIKVSGIIDVELSQGPASVKIEADENIAPFVVTRMEEGYLAIRIRDHVVLNDVTKLKVYISTGQLKEVRLSGSGNIIGKGKFTGADKLKVKVSGIGNLSLAVNAPDVEAEISGSGSIALAGETRNEQVQISGIGEYKADSLKAESVTIKISGSGNARVFADKNLAVKISGIGSVYYSGAATVTQKISGSGEVRRAD